MFDWRRLLGIPSKHIGVVYDTATLEIRAVVNPDCERQLDDPAHTSNGLAVLKINRKLDARRIFPRVMSPAHCAEAVRIAEDLLWRKSS